MPQPRKHGSAAQRQAAYRQRQASAVAQQLAAKGLPSLPVLSTIPGEVRWRQALTLVQTLLESVESEMQQYYDERSE